MKSPSEYKFQTQAWMKRFTLLALLLPCLSSNLVAQGTLAFSFEGDLQGFVANSAIPGSSTVDLDTIGATDGSNSLKLSLPAAEGYAGALTEQLDPSIFGNPPGIFSMTFDLTIETAFPEEDFVDIFVVFFGIQQGTTEPGYEVSFQFDETNRVAIGDLTPGTHPIRMEFNEGFHPLDFENFDARPYNEIFGDGSNSIDMIATGFQITVNKSQTLEWIGYIDNVRFSSTPGTPGDFNSDGKVDGRDFLLWQRGGTNPPLDPELLTAWQTNYGFGNLTAGFVAVPEPTCGLLAILGTAVGFTSWRKR